MKSAADLIWNARHASGGAVPVQSRSRNNSAAIMFVGREYMHWTDYPIYCGCLSVSESAF